jgi:hypothetical protein
MAKKIAQKNGSDEKNSERKKRANKMANFCEVGEMKTRGKWQIM